MFIAVNISSLNPKCTSGFAVSFDRYTFFRKNILVMAVNP
jgi:hypothetical protein